MKILHTIPSLNIRLGGPCTCTYQLVAGLNSIGCDTKLLSISSADAQEDVGHDTFVDYVDNDSFSPLCVSRNFNRYLSNNGESFDILHANTIWLWPTHQTYRHAKRLNLPFVLTTHGMLFPTSLKVSSWKKKIALPLFQRADLVNADLIHATSIMEMNHIRNFGLKNPIAVIPNCLQIDHVPQIRQQDNPKRIFGFVGRINRFKNIDMLLQAWKKCDLGDKAQLWIIGSGDDVYERELRTYVAENHLNNVEFKGFLVGRQLSDAVAQLDYQLLVSKSENFGMVIPEALLRGVPVITTEGTPWHELVEYKCGWSIPTTVDAICETIIDAMSKPETTRREMGLRGRDYVLSRFKSENVGAQMAEAYRWVLNGGEKPENIYV